MTFRQKMIIAFMLLVLLPVLILGLISYKISSDTLKENISRQTVQTLKAVDENLMASISEVNTFSDYIISSEEVQSFLKTNDSSSVYDFYTRQQAIAGTLYGNSHVEDFILYTEEGGVLHQNSSPVPSIDSFKSSHFFEQVRDEKGGTVWLTPSENQFLTQKDTFLLTQGRAIKDIDTLNNLGYLVLNIKLNLFDEVFDKILEEPSNEMIIDEKGKILYSLNRDLIGEEFNEDVLASLSIQDNGYIVSDWNGEKSLITYRKSSFTTGRNPDLLLVSVKPWNVLASDIIHIRNTTIGLFLIAILIAMLFDFLYLKRISNFVQQLLKSMKQAEEGKLSTRLRPFKLKELGRISTGYNTMIFQIQQLLEKVKIEQERKSKAEFRILQQQINPHFLYNTLESINALASLNGQKEISKMTINLGKLLRISINGSYEVKVRDEIRHVVSYLEIQKIRFNNRFSYDVQVDKALEESLVLKLILQPLVENILLHAFRSRENGRISIKGTVSNTRGCFWLEDNGSGIEDHVLETFQNWELNKDRENRDGGHGIRNVQERLRIYYGDGYGLMICSDGNNGTTIRISFPLGGHRHGI